MSRRPLYEIEGLISFYPHFRTRPPVKVEVRACHDLSCWLQGADRRIAELRDRYGRDADVEVTEVSCIGRCDVAPVVAVNERPVAAADAAAAIGTARSQTAGQRGQGPVTKERGLEPAGGSRGVAPTGQPVLSRRQWPLTDWLTSSGVRCVQVPASMATPPFIGRAQALGLQVHAWTVNDRPTMERLLDLGVDGIMTDETVALREVLTARGQWHPRTLP